MKIAAGWLCVASLFALPCLTGCGGSSSSGSAPPIPMALSASAALPNGLTATLTQDRYTVQVGGTVTYTIMLTNNTAQPITYQPVYGPGSGPPVPANLEITDPSGTLVYPVGPSAQVVYLGPSTTLAPGQSVSETQAVSTTNIAGLTVIEGYAHAGRYNATASIGLNALTPQSSQAPGSVGPLTVTAQ